MGSVPEEDFGVADVDLHLEHRFEGFIIKPKAVKKLWKTPRIKEGLIEIFSNHFKPKSSIEEQKVEYNEINIFAEF